MVWLVRAVRSDVPEGVWRCHSHVTKPSAVLCLQRNKSNIPLSYMLSNDALIFLLQIEQFFFSSTPNSAWCFI